MKHRTHRGTRVPGRTTAFIATAFILGGVAAGVAWPAAASGQQDRRPAPGGVTATATGANTAHVVWDAHPDGAKDYRISWKRHGENFRNWRDTGWNAYPTGTSHTITGLDAGTTYKVRVRARFGGEPSSLWSPQATVTTHAAPATPKQEQERIGQEQERIGRHTVTPHELKPLSLTAHARERLITLTWTNPSDHEITRHKVERRQGTTGPFTTLRDLDSAETSFHDTDVEPDTLYQYRVYVGDADGLGPHAEVQARTPAPPGLAAPTNLRAADATLSGTRYEAANNDVVLMWDVSEGAVGSRVTREWIDAPADGCWDDVAEEFTDECPVMELAYLYGTRNGNYRDTYNAGGTYRYRVEEIGRDRSLGEAAEIVVTVPADPTEPLRAPRNLKFRAWYGSTEGQFGGTVRGIDLRVSWQGHWDFAGYLVQWRLADGMYDADETGNWTRIVAWTRPNMYEANNLRFNATPTRSLLFRNRNQNPYEKDYYVRVGTCADTDCEIDDVIWASEVGDRSPADF